MAAEISVTHCALVIVNGSIIADFGDLSGPVGGVAKAVTDGDGVIQRARVRVPMDGSIDLWEWADTEGFSLLDAKMAKGADGVAEGTVTLWMRYSPPTSADDLTPTGSDVVWFNRELSCGAPASFDSDRAWIKSTASTVVGDTGGQPTLLADANKVNGVCDKVVISNASETEDVYVDVLIVPK